MKEKATSHTNIHFISLFYNSWVPCNLVFPSRQSLRCTHFLWRLLFPSQWNPYQMIILPVTFEAHSQTNGIWQLESHSDVLNCKLFFYYLPYYRWLTHDYSRMQKPLLYKVRNICTVRAPSRTQSTFGLHCTFYYWNKMVFWGCLNFFGFLFHLSVNEDATYI